MSENDKARQSVTLAYILYAISLVFPVACIAGVIVNHLKIGDMGDDMLASHHRWLMRTFWFGLLWGTIGFVTFPLFGIGYFVWIVAAIWFIYRVIKGWLAFSEDQAMYAEA